MFPMATWQVKAAMKLAATEGVGENAVGALDKIRTASEVALLDITKASQRCTNYAEKHQRVFTDVPTLVRSGYGRLG